MADNNNDNNVSSPLLLQDENEDDHPAPDDNEAVHTEAEEDADKGVGGDTPVNQQQQHNQSSSLSSSSSSPEDNPWRNASFICTTIQLMFTLLDLFMESGDIPAVHYTITTLQFVPALYLTVYQAVRLYYVQCSSTTSKNKHIIILLIALVLQLYVLVISGMWFDIDKDVNSHGFEWSVFAVVLLWSFVNPVTYSWVVTAHHDADADVDVDAKSKKKKKRMSPAAAVYSIFAKHFMREKFLFVVGLLASAASAILTTYQGSLINELTRMVTKVDKTTGKIAASDEDIELMATTLVGVWAAANLARFLFDLLMSEMFSRLDLFMRGAIFDKAMVYGMSKKDDDGTTSNDTNDGSIAASDFGACYSSDINGVISLYGTLLKGVVMNILLIITNFVFLVLYNWEVAVATLGFLAMAVTSGPTDLAGDAAHSVQKHETDGLGMLSEGVQQSSSIDLDSSSADNICKKHNDDVLVPMKGALFGKQFYTSTVDTYINFFSSFMTVVVVITMTYSVYYGEMKSYDFLGVFYVFKELQKPATKIGGIVKSLIKKSANLERVNRIIFA